MAHYTSIRSIFLIVFMLTLAPVLKAQQPQLPDKLHACGSGTADKALSGDRLLMTDGRVIALAEIKAPEYWPDGAAYKRWPYARQSMRALQTLTARQPLRFMCTEKSKQKNHKGEQVVHLIRVRDALWIQHTLIEEGHAYFFPHHGRTRGAEALLAAEDKARIKRIGLWAIDALQPVTATSDAVRPGWFQLVTGTVMSENRRRGKTYLNFGRDWRTDFTVEIPKRLYRSLGAEDGTLGFEGRQVEVRGWMEWAGGPKVVLWDAAQIRLVDPVAD